MNRFMRPYIRLGLAAVLGATVIVVPPASAQSSRISKLIEEPSRLLLHSGAQGYLGVLVGDVDSESAPKLKLKEVRGALITLIDHDAPAAQAGLRVSDVVLEVNGQAVEGSEQFGRMMREIPPGRKVSLVLSRDGVAQTVVVQLADRKKMETDVWNKLGSGNDVVTPAQGMGILGNGGGGDAPLPGGFHMPFFGSSLKVGAMVEPLTSQMAEYLGVPSGLMVKQVVRKSEAAAAGFKAFDVILKVGTESITTVSDWDRSLLANQGKTVQVTILRAKKQQTLTLQVDSKHKGEVDFPDAFPSDNCPLMALVDPDMAQNFVLQFPVDESAVQSMREQAEALKDQLGALKGQVGPMYIDPKQAEEFRKQAEQFRESFGGQVFQIDPQQLDKMKQQMEQFRQNFKPENFKFDENQLNQMKNQMRLVRPEDQQRWLQMEQQLRQQMDQLRRQMEEEKALRFGDHV
jgi:serine protease Do